MQELHTHIWKEGIIIARSIIKHIRFTKEEAEQLLQEAERQHQSLSAYIRQRALLDQAPQIPNEIMEQLRELNYLNRKLGNNVNQIAKTCNARREVTVFDYENVMSHMQRLEKKTDQIYAFFKGVYR